MSGSRFAVDFGLRRVAWGEAGRAATGSFNLRRSSVAETGLGVVWALCRLRGFRAVPDDRPQFVSDAFRDALDWAQGLLR